MPSLDFTVRELRTVFYGWRVAAAIVEVKRWVEKERGVPA